MIIVSSYKEAPAAFHKYAPRYVVSILDDDEGPTPPFPGLDTDRHLELRGDCSAHSGKDCITQRCSKLIDLAKKWDRKEPILIHCHQGVSRSMAAAYILLCTVEDNASETDIAQRLRNAAPHADPNLLLISEADTLLGREDRMVEAVLDLSPCAGAACDGIVTLPLAA